MDATGLLYSECKLTYLVPRSDGNQAGKFER